ncbi:MAG TPA: hypothetical protein P5204_00215 [Kiritimatiellia bacterium]|nr:hypothetical protein [Kiritimatiellia bacterium]
MIDAQHPKSLDPRVWTNALRAHAAAWGKDEALDVNSLTHWFRDAMSQAYAEGRRDGESAIRGVKRPWFAEYRRNPARKHRWQVWIPAYITVKREIEK